MKKIKCILMNQNGSMSLWAVILVFILCLIFAGLYEYIRVSMTAEHVKTVIQTDLESVIVQSAKDSFQDLKQYNLTDSYIKQTDLEARICSDLGLDKKENKVYYISKNGDEFSILNTELYCSVDTSLHANYSFKLEIPVYYFGKQVGTADIPMTVKAAYRFK